MVAFRLEGFLMRIEMQVKRVRLEHVDRFLAFLDAIAVVKLHCSEIGKKKRGGRILA